MDCLVDWLVDYVVGWLVGWLVVGWWLDFKHLLAGCLPIGKKVVLEIRDISRASATTLTH